RQQHHGQADAIHTQVIVGVDGREPLVGFLELEAGRAGGRKAEPQIDGQAQREQAGHEGHPADEARLIARDEQHAPGRDHGREQDQAEQIIGQQGVHVYLSPGSSSTAPSTTMMAMSTSRYCCTLPVWMTRKVRPKRLTLLPTRSPKPLTTGTSKSLRKISPN